MVVVEKLDGGLVQSRSCREWSVAARRDGQRQRCNRRGDDNGEGDALPRIGGCSSVAPAVLAARSVPEPEPVHAMPCQCQCQYTGAGGGGRQQRTGESAGAVCVGSRGRRTVAQAPRGMAGGGLGGRGLPVGRCMGDRPARRACAAPRPRPCLAAPAQQRAQARPWPLALALASGTGSRPFAAAYQGDSGGSTGGAA